MLFYPAALPLSRQTLTYTAGVICRRRKQIGSRWRKLNPERQALLVLAYLRKGETFADLAAGFGIGTATAWRYVSETVGPAGGPVPEAAHSAAGRGGGRARLPRAGRHADPHRPGGRPGSIRQVLRRPVLTVTGNRPYHAAADNQRRRGPSRDVTGDTDASARSRHACPATSLQARLMCAGQRASVRFAVQRWRCAGSRICGGLMQAGHRPKPGSDRPRRPAAAAGAASRRLVPAAGVAAGQPAPAGAGADRRSAAAPGLAHR